MFVSVSDIMAATTQWLNVLLVALLAAFVLDIGHTGTNVCCHHWLSKGFRLLSHLLGCGIGCRIDPCLYLSLVLEELHLLFCACQSQTQPSR